MYIHTTVSYILFYDYVFDWYIFEFVGQRLCYLFPAWSVCLLFKSNAKIKGNSPEFELSMWHSKKSVQTV